MVEMTRKQIIDSRFTIECPKCDYTLHGDEPRFFVECDKCLKINTHKQGLADEDTDVITIQIK